MATSTNSHDKGGAESLLPGVVLSEVGSTSAHQAAVPDPPHAGANVASIESHSELEHEFYLGEGRQATDRTELAPGSALPAGSRATVRERTPAGT